MLLRSHCLNFVDFPFLSIMHEQAVRISVQLAERSGKLSFQMNKEPHLVCERAEKSATPSTSFMFNQRQTLMKKNKRNSLVRRAKQETKKGWKSFPNIWRHKGTQFINNALEKKLTYSREFASCETQWICESEIYCKIFSYRAVKSFRYKLIANNFRAFLFIRLRNCTDELSMDLHILLTPADKELYISLPCGSDFSMDYRFIISICVRT